MPTDSVREQIMQRVKDTISAIHTGPDYWTTFALVERVHLNPLDIQIFPQCGIVEEDAEDDLAGLQGVGLLTPLGTVNGVHLPVTLWFADRQNGDRATLGNHMIQDLQKAMMTLDQITIAGTTLEVRLNGVSLPVTTVEDPLVAGIVTTALYFRHDESDPSQGR